MTASLPTNTRVVRAHRFRFGLRTLLVAVAAAAVLLSYVGSYYRLSRRGFAEAHEVGLAGFLYVPFDEAAATKDLSHHYWLAMVYAPLNWLDQRLFGADGPTQCVMWELSP